eukprot:scaffold2644_cov129-Cylindrotheca_fusiformis.AAC.8
MMNFREQAMRENPLVKILIGIVVCTFVVDATNLKQLHVITRHGSRPALSKDPDTLMELGGETLTPLGQKQLWDLGTWLRSRYAVDGFLEMYDLRVDRLESSNLDRTLTSANSLSMGLFPLKARLGGSANQFFQSLLPNAPAIPVFTRQDDNDIYLRSYRHCPRFTENLQRLYSTAGWNTLEENSKSLLIKLAESFPTLARDPQVDSVDLRDVWNYYDPIHVARTECNPDPDSFSCQALVEDPTIREVLTDTEFAELESLVHQTEQLKYGLSTANRLLGSNLLWQILNRSSQEGRFFLYSAHAPTILGFLTTLKEWDIGELFVDYGSALIIEVYEESYQKRSIRIVYKSGSRQEATYMPLDNIQCNDDVFGGEVVTICPLENVVAWAKENTYTTVEDWCRACGNEHSDVCLRRSVGAWTALQDRTNASEPELLAGVFFGGFFMGLFCMCLGCLCKNGLQKKDHREQIAPNGMEKRNIDHHEDPSRHDQFSMPEINLREDSQVEPSAGSGSDPVQSGHLGGYDDRSINSIS